MFKYLTHKKAFSLIELLVAISILSIVAAIAIPKYIKIQEQANIKIAQSEATTLKTALANWTASFNTPAAADAAWGTSSFLIDNTATANRAGVFSSGPGVPSLSDFLDSSMTTDNLTFLGSSSGVWYAYSTKAMRALKGTFFGLYSTTVNNTACIAMPLSGATHAHIMFFWPNDSTLRRAATPIVALFLPVTIPPAPPPPPTP